MSEMDEKVLEQNGLEITEEDELDLVTGGAKSTTRKPQGEKMLCKCTKCGSEMIIWDNGSEHVTCGGTFRPVK